jgi:hypothetical protein
MHVWFRKQIFEVDERSSLLLYRRISECQSLEAALAFHRLRAGEINLEQREPPEIWIPSKLNLALTTIVTTFI